MMYSGPTWKTWAIALTVWLPTATAIAGMPELRYRLAETPGIFWESSSEASALRDSLRELAEFGLPDAQMLLADQLSASGGFRHLNEAAVWYRRAYENGRNQAPGSLARMATKNPLLHRELRPYMQEVAGELAREQNQTSVASRLEIFHAYPDIAQPEQADRLLALYQRACINTCFRELFSARVAEMNGEEAAALALYEAAATLSGRGVSTYFDFLERFDDRPARFQAFADNLFDDADALNPDVIQGIAGKLQNLSSEFNPSVLAWLDLALATGATNASVNRIEYMLGLPESFTFEETKTGIDALEQTDPVQADLLRAQPLTTRSWKKLDPMRAYELLKNLQDQQIAEASIGMGDLYSMGGLDEVDQFRAIEEYQKAARLGYSSAFYKVASIYRYGRSICNDKLQARAYSQMALMLGEEKAQDFLDSLEQDLTLAEIAAADTLYQGLLAAYPVENFE